MGFFKQEHWMEEAAISSCRASSQLRVSVQCLLCLLHCEQTLYSWAIQEAHFACVQCARKKTKSSKCILTKPSLFVSCGCKGQEVKVRSESQLVSAAWHSCHDYSSRWRCQGWTLKLKWHQEYQVPEIEWLELKSDPVTEQMLPLLWVFQVTSKRIFYCLPWLKPLQCSLATKPSSPWTVVIARNSFDSMFSYPICLTPQSPLFSGAHLGLNFPTFCSRQS